MKRFRRQGGEGDHTERINIAGVLMLLSRGPDDDDGTRMASAVLRSSSSSSPPRVFECKTCSRQFPSFQALGGHRASHKKPRAVAEEEEDGGGAHKKVPRVHGCSVCGLEFAIGQALGGHMRRHRGPGADQVGPGAGVGKEIGSKNKVWLDLNLPPPDAMEPIPMVDCFY